MMPILSYFLPFGKAGGLQILCCQGFAVSHDSFTLSALALKPSDFCNVRVEIMITGRLRAVLRRMNGFFLPASPGFAK